MCAQKLVRRNLLQTMDTSSLRDGHLFVYIARDVFEALKIPGDKLSAPLFSTSLLDKMFNFDF